MSELATLVLVCLVAFVLLGEASWRVKVSTSVTLALAALVLWVGAALPLFVVAALLCWVGVRGLRLDWWARHGGDWR